MINNVRNVAIVLVLAAFVWAAPGGTEAAAVVSAALSAAFLSLVVWAAMRVYRDQRMAIYSLGDRYRALLYGSIAAIVVAITALAAEKFDGAYVLIWIALAAAGVYGLYRVWTYFRDYGY